MAETQQGEPPTSYAFKKKDSFDAPAIGRQYNSQKETMPSYSFGTGVRAAANKAFISKKHEKRKAVMNSPGPVYGVPSSVGNGPKFGFGTEDTRSNFRSQYPDSSVDLTCSIVDSQTIKFESTKGVHFGTEPRMNSKNAEALRDNPEVNLCTQSPISFDYNPDDTLLSKSYPEYSFGPRETALGGKIPQRGIHIPPTGTPRHVGPGSHTFPSSIGGNQPTSARKSAPSWSFGGKTSSASTPRNARTFPLLDPSPELSSLGKQVVSSARSAPSCGFGTSTRDHSARTYLVVTEADRGPAAKFPKPNFHLEMPPVGKHLPRPGL
jgi:hypothetical protein